MVSRDYTINSNYPLTPEQNELVESLNLKYDLIFERRPQFKQRSISLLRDLNNIDHGTVISYNYHTRETIVKCNITGLIYKQRPERVLTDCSCKLCISNRISKLTKEAMSRPDVKSKVMKENNSISHKKRFINNMHKGSTSIPTSTEDFIMEFMLELGFEWNPVILTGRHNDLGEPNFYKPDFLHRDKRIVIELDGSTHQGSQILVDNKKTKFFNDIGYKVYRFDNRYVYTFTDLYKDIIIDLLKGGGVLYDRLYAKSKISINS